MIGNLSTTLDEINKEVTFDVRFKKYSDVVRVPCTYQDKLSLSKAMRFCGSVMFASGAKSYVFGQVLSSECIVLSFS